MVIREERPRPASWKEYKQSVRHRWSMPWHAIELAFQWTAYFLSRWAFLAVLEYMGILSVLFAVVFYFSEAGDRKKQKHYQAWQVINTAQGKGGSGGRIEALQELNADKIPLVGVDVSGSFLQGVRLIHASLLRANLEDSDLRDCNLAGSDLEYANLRSANFRGANLSSVNLLAADLEDSDLVGAILKGANLTAANLKNADLRNTDPAGIAWRNIKAIDSANLYGARNAPVGFMEWALAHGAISARGDSE
ncbi:MAG TPA: pentapeptide repeat-containing protein [Bryobacteraceae bacterium]|nr:pentapeptide repeat-containing protein [Bryobacteraceae bacterium]